MLCMEQPTLYVKTGCPYCRAAMEALDARSVQYKEVDVRGDHALMQELQKISGQTKTPTIVWDGDVLADFGVEQLEPFLKKHARAQ